jgi:hypothetical protein
MVTRVLTPPAPPSLDVSERDLQQLILDLATTFGWWHFHPWSMRRSDTGWPDLVLARPCSPLLVWEIKAEQGQLSPEQYDWGMVLCQVPGIEYRVIRPRDWAHVVATLTAPRGSEREA